MSELATIARVSAPGGLIRERRIELGWTPAELANRSGLAETDILKIENGRLDARWSTVHRLAVALTSPGIEPKRSLANGGRRASRPKSAGERWTPKGPLGPIEPTDA